MNADEPRPDPDEMLTYKAVAKLFGVNVSTVRRWLKAKRIPEPFRVSPKSIYFRRGDLQDWLESRRQK